MHSSKGDREHHALGLCLGTGRSLLFLLFWAWVAPFQYWNVNDTSHNSFVRCGAINISGQRFTSVCLMRFTERAGAVSAVQDAFQHRCVSHWRLFLLTCCHQKDQILQHKAERCIGVKRKKKISVFGVPLSRLPLSAHVSLFSGRSRCTTVTWLCEGFGLRILCLVAIACSLVYSWLSVQTHGCTSACVAAQNACLHSQV